MYNSTKNQRKGDKTMYNTNFNKDSLKRFKNEVASELGVDLKKANLTAKEAGSVGGEMVKRMIENEKSHRR